MEKQWKNKYSIERKHKKKMKKKIKRNYWKATESRSKRKPNSSQSYAENMKEIEEKQMISSD